ncbi:hypothetical protein LZ32DRAFT_633510 [Colletotrichum eremochloae]|nr:hypothetical protein LZ32DRAFT_633510 [Colletotrichum eremochloae]
MPLFAHRESISTSDSAGAKRQGSTSTSIAKDGERVVLANMESRDGIQVALMDMQTAGYPKAERRQQRIKPTWSVHGEGSSR